MTNNQTVRDLYRRFSERIHHVIAGKIPANDVEDVELALWTRLAKTPPPIGIDNVRAYLAKAAKNQIAMYYREKGTKKRAGIEVPLPADDPSGFMVDRALVRPAEVSDTIDNKRLRQRLHELAEEMSGANIDAMRQLLEDPDGVSRADRRRAIASARRKVESVRVDGFHEAPSHLGHVIERLKGRGR